MLFSNEYHTYSSKGSDSVCSSSEAPSLYSIHHEASHRLLRLGWVVHWGLITENNASDVENTLRQVQTTKSSNSPCVDSVKRAERQQSGKHYTKKYAEKTLKGYCFLCSNEKTERVVSRLSRAQKRKGSFHEPVPLSDQLENADMVNEKNLFSSFLSLLLPHERLEYTEYMAHLHIRNCWTSFHQYAQLPFPPLNGMPLYKSQSTLLSTSEMHSGDAPLKDDTAAALTSAPPVISSFFVPAWGTLEEVPEAEVAKLLTIPYFPPRLKDTKSPLSLPARVFLYQRRCEPPLLQSTTMGKTSEKTVALCACDVYLIFFNNRSTPPELSHRLTVWCRATWSTRTLQSFPLACQDATTMASNASNEELFLISHGLPEYFRLGAIFGWIYGWQLCYSSRGPQMRSVTWLRLFNLNAMMAVRQHVNKQRYYW